MRALSAALIVLLGLAAAAVYLSAFIVHQNEQALVLQFGDPIRTINEPGKNNPGLNWKLPIVQQVEYLDKRILDLSTDPQEVIASDQKRLVVDAFARYRITDPLKFYQTVRTEQRVRETLVPIVVSALRNVLGSVTFRDVVKEKREELMKRIAAEVNIEGRQFGLEVVDVRIKRADLPEQNSKSVFDRMRSERQKEAAEYRAEGGAAANRIKATADREATIIKAEATQKADQTRGEGDAKRNAIFAEAYNRDQEFFAFYRSMLAYEAGFKAGDTRMLLTPDSEFFRYFTQPSPGPQLPRR